MKRTGCLVALVAMVVMPLGAGGSAGAQRALPAAAPLSATVPFGLDHNRITVEIEFTRPDGSIRKATAWVDLGSQFVVVGEQLARDLGLDLAVLQKGPKEAVESAQQSPPVRVGGLALDVSGIKVLIRPGDRFRPGVVAEAMLPASALRRDHVVFDYPARRMTIARPNALKPRGVGVPCRFNAETGLLQVDAILDGRTLALGVDNGSAGTWVSSTLTSEWQKRHTNWPAATGAVGSANFWGIGFETSGTLMCLPVLGVGSVRITDVALLGIGQELFDWYSTKSAGPVVGFIGANVLRRFRFEIDFPNRMTYWEAGRESEPNDLDIVGLTIRVEQDGSYTIAGVASRYGVPAVEGVQPGDRLVSIGEMTIAGARMGDVIGALRGKPGETRALIVERAGKRVDISAKVIRFP